MESVAAADAAGSAHDDCDACMLVEPLHVLAAAGDAASGVMVLAPPAVLGEGGDGGGTGSAAGTGVAPAVRAHKCARGPDEQPKPLDELPRERFHSLRVRYGCIRDKKVDEISTDQQDYFRTGSMRCDYCSGSALETGQNTDTLLKQEDCHDHAAAAMAHRAKFSKNDGSLECAHGSPPAGDGRAARPVCQKLENDPCALTRQCV